VVDTNSLLSTLYHILERNKATAEMQMLKTGDITVEPTSSDDSGTTYYTLTVSLLPSQYAAQIEQQDLLQANLLSALRILYRSIQGENFEAVAIVPKLIVEPTKIQADPEVLEVLMEELVLQEELMIAVATGGPKINSVNQEYKDRQIRITEILRELNLKNPVPFDDLWKWYGHWSSGKLPTYASRRAFVSELFDPLNATIENIFEKSADSYQPPPVTGWTRVDRTTAKVSDALSAAQNEEDYQAIGLLCRENLISLSSVVFRPEKHKSFLDKEPSDTDAKRMLDAYFGCELAGSSNEEMRRFAKSATALANALTHSRTASGLLAGVCASATYAVISIARIIEDERSN